MGHVVADPWREEHVFAAAHFGHGVVSLLGALECKIELQLQAHARGEPAVVADIEIGPVAGTVLVAAVERGFEAELHEYRVLDAEWSGQKSREQHVRSAG